MENGLGVGCIVCTIVCTLLIVNIMRNKHYKIKGIRMSEDTWQRLKEKRIKSGKTWNRFLLDLMDIKNNESKKV